MSVNDWNQWIYSQINRFTQYKLQRKIKWKKASSYVTGVPEGEDWKGIQKIMVEKSQIWWNTKTYRLKKLKLAGGKKITAKNYMWWDMIIKYLTTKDKHLESSQSGGANLNDSGFLIWNLGAQKDVVQHFQ